MHRRSPRQRWVAARYDGAHALLVRLVHPLCFAAFTLLVTAVAGGLGYAVFSLFDEGGAAYAIAFFGFVALVAGFRFVATPFTVVVGLVSLGGWTIALFVVDDLPSWLPWVLVAVACLSIAIQFVLLVRVIPDRWRNGLMHLLWPSVLGTVVGALPVVALVVALLDDRDDAVRDIAAYSFLAGCAVLVVLLVLHAISRRGDEGVLEEFALRHGLARGTAELDGNDAPRFAALTPKFGSRTSWWSGTVGARNVSTVTGCTSSWATDLPSLHITVLALSMRRSGRDVWVRRRSWSHDNVLASLGRSEVVRFESIRLSDEFTVRFAAGTGELTAFRTVGPELVLILGEELGAAQVCRIGSTLALFIVGGALDADELDRVLDAGQRIADLLERADAAVG